MQAVILAAGAGTRLRGISPIKPLANIAGRPLIAHVLDRLGAAGVDEAIVVLGYQAATVASVLDRVEARCSIRSVVNRDWDAPNGVSVLAAAPYVRGRALLVMSDHLVEPALYRRVAAAAASPDVTLLGIDRRLGHPWVDEEDVTRVATEGDRITAIGKLIPAYDAYDTGVFNVGRSLFDTLAVLPQPSLSDGMRLLASDGLAIAVDCGTANWLDVDDPRAFRIAEDWVTEELVSSGF